MRLCVIGDPVGHSLSPRIHRRFMERCGAAGSYEAVTVTAETLEDFVAQGRRGAWDGCNVTMPLKERILPLLDAVEPWTASCGAVNTVCFRNGRAVGYNTDGPGVVESLRLRGFAPSGQAALVLGAGGAAKAAALALALLVWSGERRRLPPEEAREEGRRKRDDERMREGIANLMAYQVGSREAED